MEVEHCKKCIGDEQQGWQHLCHPEQGCGVWKPLKEYNARKLGGHVPWYRSCQARINAKDRARRRALNAPGVEGT